MGPGGIEPPTSPLSGVRSSHLSYGPSARGSPSRERFACHYPPLSTHLPSVCPASPAACSRTSLASPPLNHRAFAAASSHWWSWSGSNRRPPECKSGALPAELQPLMLSARSDQLSASNPASHQADRRPLFAESYFHRGQLDAGTTESSPRPPRNPSIYSKWRLARAGSSAPPEEGANGLAGS